MPFTKLQEKWRQNREDARKNAAAVKHLLLQKGTPIFLKYGIEKAVIFGSIVDGRHTSMSDIDLFVQYLANERFFDFKRELEDALNIPVDLHTDKDDSSFIKKIMSRGEVIYEV